MDYDSWLLSGNPDDDEVDCPLCDGMDAGCPLCEGSGIVTWIDGEQFVRDNDFSVDLNRRD